MQYCPVDKKSLPFPLRINTPKTDRVTIRYTSTNTAEKLVSDLQHLVHELNMRYVQVSAMPTSTDGTCDVTIAVDLDLIP